MRTDLGSGRGDGYAAPTAAVAPASAERVLPITACEHSCVVWWVLVLELMAVTTTVVAIAAASVVDDVDGGAAMPRRRGRLSGLGPMEDADAAAP